MHARVTRPYLSDIYPRFQERFGISKGNHRSDEDGRLPETQSQGHKSLFHRLTENRGRKGKQRYCTNASNKLPDENDGKMMPRKNMNNLTPILTTFDIYISLI